MKPSERFGRPGIKRDQLRARHVTPRSPSLWTDFQGWVRSQAAKWMRWGTR